MSDDVRAVLFDVDDTLFDRKLAQNIALEQIVAQFPRLFQTLETERIAAAFTESDRITTRDFEAGAPSDGLRDARSRQFLRLLDIQEDYAEAITAIYVRECPKVNAPVPGAITVVEGLSRRFKVGVVSNGLPDIQYQKLETIGLRHLFSCIILSEEIGIRKPDPRIFSHAASRLNVSPQECLNVGDSYANDVVGAKNAGMMTCWFNRSSVPLDNEKAPADFMVSNLEELGDILIEK